MPSSTSSSDTSTSRAWLKAIALGLIAGSLLLACWEGYWRMNGFSPVIEDDLGIWAVNRLAVQDNRNRTIALLGSSRMQLDVDPKLVRELTGSKTIMLAIDGSSPLPVLKDLSEDNNFRGTVICSLLPQWLADSETGKSRSAKWVRKFHTQKWSTWIETRLSIWLQSMFVFRYPGVLPDMLWKKHRQGEAPKPPYAPLRVDRYRAADYTKTDITQLRSSRLDRQKEIIARAQPLDENQFTVRLNEIESMVWQIQQRGGEVIFLRLPACGQILALEEQTWPRKKYWDRFTNEISASTYHFADYRALSRYDCPDGSHLDYQDANTFTRSLLEVISLR